MKTTAVGFMITAALGIASSAPGQAVKSSVSPENLPVLKAGVRINAAGKALTLGHTACPEVIDWNNDGKKDLLVGAFQNGKVFIFLNRGTDADPQFDAPRALQAAGKDISVGFG